MQRNVEIDFNIQRDNTYGILSGKIIDENREPVKEAMIDVVGI